MSRNLALFILVLATTIMLSGCTWKATTPSGAIVYEGYPLLYKKPFDQVLEGVIGAFGDDGISIQTIDRKEGVVTGLKGGFWGGTRSITVRLIPKDGETGIEVSVTQLRSEEFGAAGIALKSFLEKLSARMSR